MLPCLQNPTTHYDSGGSLISGNPNTWIDKGSTKSIYDPCPYGYRAPKDGTWAAFPKQYWTDGDIKGGGVWQSTWWPAAGWRNTGSSAMISVTFGGRYWSSSVGSSIAYYSYYLVFDFDGNVTPSYYAHRSYGLSLRCVQE